MHSKSWVRGGPKTFWCELQHRRVGTPDIQRGHPASPSGDLEAHPAQDLSNHHGVTIRLHDDGRIPSDNPFVGQDGARPEIWSYGHRNPQGLAFHPETGDLWLTEHGPQGGDELNVVLKGQN
jgi:glucose/arabinose dehydrogenase